MRKPKRKSKRTTKPDKLPLKRQLEKLKDENAGLGTALIWALQAIAMEVHKRHGIASDFLSLDLRPSRTTEQHLDLLVGDKEGNVLDTFDIGPPEVAAAVADAWMKWQQVRELARELANKPRPPLEGEEEVHALRVDRSLRRIAGFEEPPADN